MNKLEVWLLLSTVVVVVYSLWALIALSKTRMAMWIMVPLLLAMTTIMSYSVPALKGEPSERIPEGSWFVLQAIEHADKIFLWVSRSGIDEPFSLVINNPSKKFKDELNAARREGQARGLPLVGRADPKNPNEIAVWVFAGSVNIPKN